MKTLGIIAEYNPFHKGHESHLLKSKELLGCDAVAVVLSGNFVQRGEPALCDKWRRTKMALLAGADLVIELPLHYACAGAEYFARASVTLLEKSGLADCLCFGSEWADIDALKSCAEALGREDESFKARLRENLRQGLSYPAARAKAADTTLPDSPNNILGLEYIKALTGLGSKMTAHTTARSPGSAKEIRDSLKRRETPLLYQNMPPYALDILNDAISAHGFADLDNLSSIFRCALFTRKGTELQECLDVSEGLENRLIQCARENMLISDIISAAKTKRYTHLRLQRAALHIILGIKKRQMAAFEAAGGPQYIRVLGFNKKRAWLLRRLEEKAVLPVVINLKKAQLPPLAAQMLEDEVRSSKVYSLAYQRQVYFNEYAMPLILR
jgi:predicted nucleotidyltransferase